MRSVLFAVLFLGFTAAVAGGCYYVGRHSEHKGMLVIYDLDSYNQLCNDWPDLNHYKTENARLGFPTAGEQRVVFFGDSITYFWFQNGNYFPNKPYINRAIAGQTTPQMLLRFQQDVIALHPQAVIILAGINDIGSKTGPASVSSIEDNFRSMITLAKQAHIRVILSSVLPSSALPWQPTLNPAPAIHELNLWLEGTAKSEDLIYANYYPSLVNDRDGIQESLAYDKLHPNAAGYAVMQPIAASAIAASLAKPRP